MEQSIELTPNLKTIDNRDLEAKGPVEHTAAADTFSAVAPSASQPEAALTGQPPPKQEQPATGFIQIRQQTFQRLLWISCILNLIGAACYYVAVVLVHFDPLLGLQFVIPARSGTTLFAIAFSCDVVWVASTSTGVVGAVDVLGTALSAVSFAGLTATAVSSSYALLLAAAWALFTGLSMKLFAHFHAIYTLGWAAALRQHEPAQLRREALCMTWALGVGGTLGALVLGYSTLLPVEEVPVWYSAGAGGIATAVAVGISNVVLRLREAAPSAGPSTAEKQLNPPGAATPQPA